jgi:uncharacterized protein (TIGR02466 family)
MAAALETRTGIIQEWGTPILQRKIPDSDKLNAALIAEVRKADEAEESLSLGMVSAHKAGFSILKSQSDAVNTLHRLIFEAADAMNRWCLGDNLADGVAGSMISEAWAVIYRTYGYHKLHLHHGSAWSGVYYVKTGDLPSGAGAIEMLDPRQAARPRCDTGGIRSIDPEPGMIIAFPSWLQHFVTPVEGSAERICIAFNVGFIRDTIV